MKTGGWLRHAMGGVLAVSAVAGVAAPLQAPGLKVLSQVEPGRWQLREVDSGQSRTVCVSDPRMLIQLHHGAAQCSRFVVDNQATSGTVHYTCSGAGHGRTTISIETPRLIHVQTQGLANGAPFSSDIEGRRQGGC
jgi:hypothetical protein